MTYQRYAIYVTPQPGDFADLGAAWLGWDVARGDSATQPDLEFDLAKLTKRPRKYGLHGTIKPPFHLTQGAHAAELLAQAKMLCATCPPVTIEALTVTRFGAMLAFRPNGDITALSDLAAKVVTGLDPFRAPPSSEELTKRRAGGLSPAQEAALTAWGYPYVMDEFRFHITLTGPIRSDIAPVQKAAERWFAPVLNRPFEIADLTLCGQSADGNFREIARLPLLGRRGKGA